MLTATCPTNKLLRDGARQSHQKHELPEEQV